MINVSRRALANFAVDQLIANESLEKLSKSLASMLVSSGKKNDSELLILDIYEILEARGILANATITSAKSLSAKSLGLIKDIITTHAKVNEVIINEVIDESAIGGFKAETSAHSWDKTIARKLTLIKGGN